ncbi:MAG: hypothetical protein NC407_02535 [Lachnoclostridium sp.]|nr:hypothetical protein [Lachnoclostridium sp.]
MDEEGIEGIRWLVCGWGKNRRHSMAGLRMRKDSRYSMDRERTDSIRDEK